MAELAQPALQLGKVDAVIHRFLLFLLIWLFSLSLLLLFLFWLYRIDTATQPLASPSQPGTLRNREPPKLATVMSGWKPNLRGASP